MVIIALALSFITDIASICADIPNPICYINVEKCFRKNQREGLEPDIYFHICAEEAELNKWWTK